MTNSYKSFLPNKIVFIHGLNNNSSSFGFLRNSFEKLGYTTELVILPCHGENRMEAKSLEEAMKAFDRSMEKVTKEPYFAIAFSHGALYLQLWLERFPGLPPEKQILLAPALMVRKQKILELLSHYLPETFVLRSFSPPAFRRYEALSVWEYNILIHGMLEWQKTFSHFPVPTKVMIDPHDELVDAKRLSQKFEVHLIDRPYARGMGAHHILFHPDYFSTADWDSFLSEILRFLQV